MPATPSPKPWFVPLCSFALSTSAIIAMAASLRWPLVGDASLMHYVVFLLHHGLTPYRDIIDINMPGTYAFEALAMRIFGAGAFAWRIYDAFLLISITASAVLLAGKGKRFAGLFAGCLFALVHLQDGLAQGGQRNLLMAALLLWGFCALFQAQRSEQHRTLLMLLTGLSLGSTLTIKPVLLPLAVALLLAAAWSAHRQNRSAWETFWPGLIGIALPSAAALLWLIKAEALHPFLSIVTGLLPLHAALGRQSFGFLFSHCLSPVLPIVGLWLLILLLQRPPLTTERFELLIGIAGTGFAYFAEGKGYPYQRYTLLAILFVAVGRDLTEALTSALAAKVAPRMVALCTCALVCLVMVPRYAWLVTTFGHQAPFQEGLSTELTKLGTPAQLDGNVQCLDTFAGCVNSLYDLRIRQSTGYLYDCYLFSADSPERARYREAFWSAFQAAKPSIVIETSQLCFGDIHGFDKINTWPQLAQILAQDYTQQPTWHTPILQHWWNRKDEPAEFRLYLRKPGP